MEIIQPHNRPQTVHKTHQTREQIEALRCDVINGMSAKQRVNTFLFEVFKFSAAAGFASNVTSGDYVGATTMLAGYCIASFAQASYIGDAKEKANHKRVERGTGYWFDPKCKQVAKPVSLFKEARKSLVPGRGLAYIFALK